MCVMPRLTAPPSQSQPRFVKEMFSLPCLANLAWYRWNRVRLGQSLQQYALKLTNLIMQ